MIAFELGNFIGKTFAGCVMISGRILSQHSFKNNFFINTPLMIVHGDKMMSSIPNILQRHTRLTKSNGFTVEEHLIKGEGHTISLKTSQLVQNFLKKYV